MVSNHTGTQETNCLEVSNSFRETASQSKTQAKRCFLTCLCSIEGFPAGFFARAPFDWEVSKGRETNRKRTCECGSKFKQQGPQILVHVPLARVPFWVPICDPQPCVLGVPEF